MADDRESELLGAAQRGDRRALEDLLRSQQERVHAVCRRMLGNEADAMDATQEALISIVRGIDRFDGRSAVSTWVYRIATNACLDEIRRRGRRPVPVDQDGPGPVATIAPGRADEQVADRLDIDAALARLPAEFRAPVVLRDLCQLDYAEIAEVLDIPPGTVRSRIARGRSSLASMLGPSGNPGPDRQRPTPAP